MTSLKQFTIRSMTEEDLRIVLTWRNSERVRQNMFSDQLITWEDHCRWFAKIRSNETYKPFIIELEERQIGLVSLTDIDYKHNRCSWGLYLGESDVPRGSGTAMGILALTLAFEELKIHKVCAEVLTFNEASLRYHSRLGFLQEGYLSQHFLKNEKYEDVVLFACFSHQWPGLKQKLSQTFS